MEVRNRQRKGVTGPKLQYLRHCVNIESTDILILTETRARTAEESQSTYIKKSGLAVTMSTSSGRAAAGVTVLTGPQLQMIEGSIRESEPTGHYTLGVYKTHGVLIIVGGVYLDSSRQEQLGIDALQRLTAHVTELKQLYGTDTIILTGDFNVTLHASQCHSGRINKPRTSQELQDLMTEHRLLDTGHTHGNVDPTYRRHGDAQVYSRIDFTLSNMTTKQYTLGWGPMDHAYVSVQAELPSTRHVGLPSIKDWIIGSSTFLKQGRGVIIHTLLEHDAHLTHITAQEHQNMLEMGIPEGFERRLQITDPEEGITELHVLNVIITRLQSLAGRLLRQDRDRTNQVVTNINYSLTQLHQRLQDDTLTDNDKQGINVRITELKVHLKDKLTRMATQDNARIDAFISKDRGRMTKCSFTGIKDKKGHKNID